MAGAIKTAITDILSALGTIEGVEHSAIWNNQLSKQDSGGYYVFAMPALFLEMMPPGHTELGMGVTQADIGWRIHICVYQLDAGDGNLDQNLIVYDLRDKVKTALTGLQPANCTPLYHVGEITDTNHEQVYHYTIDFVCGLVDTKGSPLDPESTKYIIKQPPVELVITNKKDGTFTGEFTKEFK